MSYLYVMLGGALGAGLRLGAAQVAKSIGAPIFFSTLSVNLIGSFLIGIAFALFVLNREPSSFAPFVITGILGGFTTFSAFSLEMMQFIGTGRFLWALVYALVSVILGILACYIGMSLAR